MHPHQHQPRQPERYSRYTDPELDIDALLALEQFNPELGTQDIYELLDETRTSDIVERQAQSTYNSQVQNEIQDLHAKYGTAFAAFLTLDDVDLTGGGIDLEQQFLSCYLGSFTDYDQLARAHIQALGWQEQFDRLIQAEAIPPSFLHWDYQAVKGLIHEAWDLIELDGRIHQFAK